MTNSSALGGRINVGSKRA